MRRSARTPRKPQAFVPDVNGKGGDFQDGGVPRGLLTSPEAASRASRRASRSRDVNVVRRSESKTKAANAEAADAGKPVESSRSRSRSLSRSRSPARRSMGVASAAPSPAPVNNNTTVKRLAKDNVRRKGDGKGRRGGGRKETGGSD